MARTAAERKRESRTRKRLAEAEAPDMALSVVHGSFANFLGGRTLYFEETLDSLGVELRGTSLDETKQSFASDGLGQLTMSSLERATGLAGAFLDAAVELHALINEFKLSELEARLKDLEAADLSDPAAKHRALRDVVHLTGLRDRLSRDTRRTFATIEVKSNTEAAR